jgi:hypothetical protein
MRYAEILMAAKILRQEKEMNVSKNTKVVLGVHGARRPDLPGNT